MCSSVIRMSPLGRLCCLLVSLKIFLWREASVLSLKWKSDLSITVFAFSCVVPSWASQRSWGRREESKTHALSCQCLQLSLRSLSPGHGQCHASFSRVFARAAVCPEQSLLTAVADKLVNPVGFS